MNNMFLDPDYDLDIMGAIEETDKCSSYASAWDYLRHYEVIFQKWRDAPINLVEIGIGLGGSLRTWQSYFRAATIVGVDVNPACRQYAGDRMVVEIGSQDDPGFLHYLCVKYPPTIIIDDGSHVAQHMVYSFERLFPALEPGGFYVVEDMAFHFDPGTANSMKSADGVSVADYFLDLARSCMARNLGGTATDGTARYVFEQIDSVQFIRSAVIIQKTKRREISNALRFAERNLLQDGAAPQALAHKYERVAQYILRHGGPLDRAEAMARRAVEVTNHAPGSAEMLAETVFRLQRLDEAAAILNRAIELHGENGSLGARLGNIERARGNYANAAVALRRASTVRPADPHILDQLSLALEAMGDMAEALSVAEHAAELARGGSRHVARLQRIATLRAKSG